MQCLKHIKMPRFLVASDLGSVVSCGLKTDSVLAEYRDGHCGTVHSVHRSQAAVIVTRPVTRHCAGTRCTARCS